MERGSNGVDLGTRGRVQRSIRVYECESREVESAAANRIGRYLCLAAFAPPRVLHQTETHMSELGSHSEHFGGVQFAAGWGRVALR